MYGYYVVDVWIYAAKYDVMVTDFSYLNFFINLLAVYLIMLSIAQIL
jgi:hypothetical protein